MKILFLASNPPTFFHSYSHNLVLYFLIKEAAKFHKVYLATTTNEAIKESNYFEYLGDYSNKLMKKKKIFNFEYEFIDNENILNNLKISEMDKIILFWDTWFDLLNFGNYSKNVITYLAKPRFSNDLSKTLREFSNNLIGTLFDPKKVLNLFNLFILKNLHYRRLKKFKKNLNICKVDTEKTLNNKVNCQYCSNTWPDFFNQSIIKKRKKINKKKINILANMGHLQSTGNKIGLTYLKVNILPNLLKYKNICVNICGSGKVEKDLLKFHFLKFKGFVKNINLELLKNQIFLLCNNTGYHYGGYTRVIFMMSSGGVLIADKRLKKSMPELVHMNNCLLSSNKTQMLDNIDVAIDNFKLRQFIGINARNTYEENWSPEKVWQKII